MVELRTTAEALLQTAQIHQRNFEVMAREMNEGRRNVETLAQGMETLVSETNESTRRFDQLHQESNQRFDIMLAELRQLRIEGELRFNGMQTEIRRIIDHIFNQGEPE
jgi:uncharacterized protein YaaN involved in tellurite resistance